MYVIENAGLSFRVALFGGAIRLRATWRRHDDAAAIASAMDRHPAGKGRTP